MHPFVYNAVNSKLRKDHAENFFRRKHHVIASDITSRAMTMKRFARNF